MKVLQKFSKEKVQIINIHHSMSTEDLISMYDSFDIMITPSGNHLLTGMYGVNPHTKAIVQIVPFFLPATQSFYERAYDRRGMVRFSLPHSLTLSISSSLSLPLSTSLSNFSSLSSFLPLCLSPSLSDLYTSARN